MAALTAWMIVLRVAQLFCSMCCAGFHGVLAVYWGIHGLSSFGGMITLELMVSRNETWSYSVYLMAGSNLTIWGIVRLPIHILPHCCMRSAHRRAIGKPRLADQLHCLGLPRDRRRRCAAIGIGRDWATGQLSSQYH
jgi:hypothetical protein